MLCHILKKLRENSGYTQQQVAEVLNIDRSTYAYYETGKTTPDINTIIKLSKIFNVPYTEIFEDEENCQFSMLSDVKKGNDNNSYISKYGRKNNKYHIYELSRKEQQIIIGYRLLTAEQQTKLLSDIYSCIQSFPKKRNSRKALKKDSEPTE